MRKKLPYEDLPLISVVKYYPEDALRNIVRTKRRAWSAIVLVPWLPQSKDLQGRCYIDPARSWNSEFPWSCAPWRGRTQPLKTWTQIAQFWTSRARAKKLGRAPDVRRHVPAGSLRAPQLTAREKSGGRRRRACQCPQNRHTAVFNIFSHVVFTSINIFFLRQWRPVLHFGNLEICAFFCIV